jgi:hypothetical protein
LTSPGTIPAVTADVGSYTLRAQLATNSNYAVSVARDASLTISPRPVTLTINDLATSKTDLSNTPTSVSNLPSGVTVAQAFPFLTFRATPLTAPVERFGATLTGATSSLIEAIGYQSSVNYLVTAIPGYRTIVPEATTVDLGLTPSSFTLSKPAVTEADIAAIDAAKKGIVVGTELKLPTPFRGPEAQPYLETAAKALMAQLAKSGDSASLAAHFKDGVPGFLAGLESDPSRQAMIAGALSDVVRGYAMLPAAAQPPELAGMIKAALDNARQVKIDQAKEVVRRYDEWAKPPPPGTPVVMNTGDLRLVPDFANQVQKSFGKDAAIVVASSLGTGATVGALMAAMPVGLTTAAGLGSGSALSAAGFSASSTLASVAAGTGTTATAAAAAIAAPVLVAALATAVIVTAGVMLEKQPAIIAAIDEARATTTKNRENVTIDLANENDLAAFNAGFIKLMLGGGAF